MVTQTTEPATLGRKTPPITVPSIPRVTQRPSVVHSSHVYGSMAEKDSAEVGAYLRATAGPGNT
jgi:hypothetical protein